MKQNVPRYVSEARVALVLGLPVEKLDRICQEMGLGQVVRAGDEAERFFSYEEVQKLIANTAVAGPPANSLDDTVDFDDCLQQISACVAPH